MAGARRGDSPVPGKVFCGGRGIELLNSGRLGGRVVPNAGRGMPPVMAGGNIWPGDICGYPGSGIV